MLLLINLILLNLSFNNVYTYSNNGYNINNCVKVLRIRHTTYFKIKMYLTKYNDYTRNLNFIS